MSAGDALRRAPHVGDEVYIVHLAAWQAATISEVHDGGRRVVVQGHDDQATSEFVLSPATARFVSGGSHGPRLRWARPSATEDGSV